MPRSPLSPDRPEVRSAPILPWRDANLPSADGWARTAERAAAPFGGRPRAYSLDRRLPVCNELRVVLDGDFNFHQTFTDEINDILFGDPNNPTRMCPREP
jgi:hypothetical protein